MSAGEPSEAGFRGVLRRAIAQDFHADRRNQHLIALGASTIFPALLGLWGAATPDVWKLHGAWVVVPVWILLVAFQVALAWRLLDRPATVGVLLQSLGEAEARAAAVDRALAVTTQAARQANFLQSWLLSAYPLLAALPPDAQSDHDAIGKLLDLLLGDPLPLFGLSSADVWSFAIYMHDTETGTLRCRWRRCDPRHPSVGQLAREWSPGIGHIGVAFQNPSYRSGHRGLMTSDATSEHLRAIFEAPADRFRPYDPVAYRSFASIPFGSFDETKPSYGVIVGTSNQPGAFTELSALPLRHVAMLLTAQAQARLPVV